MKNLPILLGLLFLAFTSPLQATWYNENIDDGADIIMMDLRWPWWPAGTYFANWNTSFNPKPNNITFYAGFTSFLPYGPGQTPNPDQARQDSFRPGSVWTFWGSSTEGTPVRFIDVAPNLYIKNTYGGEGSSGTTGATVWPFVQRGHWYTMLSRVWQPVGGDASAYVGRWLKDCEKGEWHLIGIAQLPIAATSFKGNSGFLEPLVGEKAVRSIHRRFGYFRRESQWRKSDTLSIDKTQYVIVNTVPEGDHEYTAIEYAQNPAHLPQQLHGAPLAGDRKYSFTAKEPSAPTLDKPSVTNVTAVLSGGAVAVSWEIPATASPAFSFKVEVFDNDDATGMPIAVKEQRMPSLRHMIVNGVSQARSIRLTLTDIFDQTAPPIIIHPRLVKVAAPQQPSGPTRAGLVYELYVKDSKQRVNYFDPPLQNPDEQHTWLTLDELSQGRLVQRGLSRGFDTEVRENRTQGYAFVFTGLLRVPTDGPYIFHAQIDGAYRIEFDGAELLAWDGQHGTTDKAAVALLAKGDHPIRVTHVYDALPAANFSIEWEGPALERQPIPLESLRVVDEEALPTPIITSKALGDGTGVISVDAGAHSHIVNKTKLYLGSLQLAESHEATVQYSGPLPAGMNHLWARVVFDGDRTVDAPAQELQVTGRPVSGDWQVRNVGDAKASAGLWQTGEDSFQFFGNGMHTVTRHLTGDFTATCHVINYNGSHSEPVNPRAWVGLTAREYGDRINWNWGRDFHLVQTARDGLRTSADSTDLGAGRISSYALPKDRPWLRIVRQGHIWTAWTSADGRQWEIGGYQFKKTAPTMDVGLFFSALPQEARAHYHADVDHFAIQPGLPEGLKVPELAAATDTAGDRLTGVVMAPSDPKVIVVRSSHIGLLRSTDGGQTWKPANGALSGEDLAVRSVAIHPQNPEVMLRAGGRGTHGRLWKTSDGGSNWAPLHLEADFDGAGPSALCGEIVAFDLRDPNILYVGAESQGFFKSSDSGTSWTRLGLEGERVTAVVVWSWERYYPAPAKGKTQLCVTTCPDRWMTLLGRGQPAVAATYQASRSYVSNDGVQTLTIADERADTGFYNVAFDKASQSVSEMRYATSHGCQAQISAGSHMALYPPQKSLEWFRPCTAIAATALGDEKFGRCIAQSLCPSLPGRYSVSERWAYEWSWLTPKGDVPTGGLIAVAGDVRWGKVWCFLHTDGLYISNDGGKNLTKRLAASP